MNMESSLLSYLIPSRLRKKLTMIAQSMPVIP